MYIIGFISVTFTSEQVCNFFGNYKKIILGVLFQIKFQIFIYSSYKIQMEDHL